MVISAHLFTTAWKLLLEELAEITGFGFQGSPRFDPKQRFSEPKDILHICSYLIFLEDQALEDSLKRDGKRIVRLAHSSVKDYLVSESKQGGLATGLSFQEVDANLSLAEDCLAYLLQFDALEILPTQIFDEYPLAAYAARYWTRHVFETDSGECSALIMELFLTQRHGFLNWIRFFDPDFPEREPNLTRGSDTVAAPLYYASLAGFLGSAILLIEKGADVDAQGGKHGNALQAASYGGHDRVVRTLLYHGAYNNTRGGFFWDRCTGGVIWRS